jgi:hypothetical protein
LVYQQHKFVVDIVGTLNVEAGLREARVPAYHANLVNDLAQILDIEAGLTAILSAADDFTLTTELPARNMRWTDTEPVATTIPNHRDDEPAEHDTFLVGLIQAAASWTPSMRLAMRAHPIFTITNFQERVQDLIVNIGPAGDLAKGLNQMLQRALRRILDRVVGLSPDLNWAFDRDVDQALDSARILGTHLDQILDRIRNHSRDLARNLGSELTHIRTLDRLPALDLGDALDHILRLDHALDRNLIKTTNYAHLDPRDLAHSLDHVRSLVSDLDRIYSFAGELAQTIQAITHFHQVLSDVTAADLRKIDLTSIPLLGLRWSTRTRWPPESEEQIWHDSVQIADGIFEIGRSGTAHVPTSIW